MVLLSIELAVLLLRSARERMDFSDYAKLYDVALFLQEGQELSGIIKSQLEDVSIRIAVFIDTPSDL